MACWGSDAPRGCSKSPHQGCLEVPKREDREHAQPLIWVKVFQAWRGSFFRKPVCCSMRTGLMEMPKAMCSHLQAPCSCPDCSIQESGITAGHTRSHLRVRTGPSCAPGNSVDRSSTHSSELREDRKGAV